MATVIFRHKVGDINAWLKGHEERVKLFAPVSAGFKTFQDNDDPNSVLLVMEVNDMVKMETMLNDPETQDAKNRHTVIEPVTVSTQLDFAD